MILLYDEVYSSFLGYVDDYEIATMTKEQAYEDMREKLKKATSKPYIRQLFASIQFDDVDEAMEFELKQPVDEDEDRDFVCDIMAKGMAIEWLEPQVKSCLLTRQIFSNKEQKFYSQSNFLSEQKDLLDRTRSDQRHMIMERGFIYNPYNERRKKR